MPGRSNAAKGSRRSARLFRTEIEYLRKSPHASRRSDFATGQYPRGGARLSSIHLRVGTRHLSQTYYTEFGRSISSDGTKNQPCVTRASAFLGVGDRLEQRAQARDRLRRRWVQFSLIAAFWHREDGLSVAQEDSMKRLRTKVCRFRELKDARSECRSSNGRSREANGTQGD